ncbi:hypothetical protein NN561_017131 [Cricetulus griseus]
MLQERSAAGPARNPPGEAPRLGSSGEAGGSAAGPGDEHSERAQGPVVAARGDPTPGPARLPAAPGEAGAGEGLALAWRVGPGTRGRRRRPLEGHGCRVAASGTQHCGCGESGRTAPAAATASETRRLPGALGFVAARSKQPLWAVCSRERRARGPRFPRTFGREPRCKDPRGSALEDAGVRAPG